MLTKAQVSQRLFKSGTENGSPCGIKLKPGFVKLLRILLFLPLLLWIIALLKIWVDARKDTPTDIGHFPGAHFESAEPVVGRDTPPPEDFHDSWYCDVQCPFGQPCEYRDEVDFRIIVMTHDRTQSLEHCLDFVYKLDTLGDTVSVEIWADLLPDGTISKNVTETAEQFIQKWSKGTKKRRACFHEQKGKANIGGQWIDTWRPREDGQEIGLILEDDIMVSPQAYRWIKAAHAKYGHLTNVAGYTLQMEDTNMFAPIYAVHPMRVDSQQTAFMYPILGTWGYAPHPRAWRHFQDWYHTVRPERDIATDYLVPRVPGILPDRWYRMFRGQGRQETMWSMWHIKFTHDRRLFTVYCNMHRHLEQKHLLLSSNRKEPGLHFSGTGIDMTANLLTEWIPEFDHFPEQTLELNYDGSECTLQCCFCAVCEGVLTRYFSLTRSDMLLSLLPWKGIKV